VYRVLMCMGERKLLQRFAAIVWARPKAWSLDEPNDPAAKARYAREQHEAVLAAVFVYPALQTMVAPLAPFPANPDAELVGAVRVWDHVKDRVADYLTEYGRPEQIAAWRAGQPYVADLAENSAGR
jgi:hypothetical protein